MERLQARPNLLALIKSVAKENSVSNAIISDVKTNAKGEGYLGEIFMVTVKDPKTGTQHQMVIKAAFMDSKIRELAPIRMCFENEIYFYQVVLPSLEQFAGHHIASVPKCLKVCDHNTEEVLILENLRNSGFEIFDKTLILDEEHVKLIFQTYGRFHAYSVALRDQKPAEFEEITKNFQNGYEELSKNMGFKQHMLEIAKTVQEILVPGEDDVVIEKFEKYCGNNIVDAYLEVVTNDENCAILHGDCWSNNMMFKYDVNSIKKIPTELRLIDFQLVKVGSPVCDLSYCLYSGASKIDFDNLNEHLRTYYDSFSSCVRDLGSDPEKLFPFSTLLEHWKLYSKFGMIMSLAILKMKLIHKDDIVDLTDCTNGDLEDMVELMKNLKFDKETYVKRIRALLKHMSDVDAL